MLLVSECWKLIPHQDALYYTHWLSVDCRGHVDQNGYLRLLARCNRDASLSEAQNIARACHLLQTLQTLPPPGTAGRRHYDVEPLSSLFSFHGEGTKIGSLFPPSFPLQFMGLRPLE